MSDDQTQMSEDDADLAAANNRNATISGGAGDYVSPYPDQVLENVLENVLVFLTSRRDRSAVSLVCKSWYRAEALTRSELFIGNCYAVSPARATDRFKMVRSVALKGKPRFADFSLMPSDWGAHFTPWVYVMANAYRALEKLYLKRMSVTDDDLSVVAHSFTNFKEIVLVCCDGFGTSGLSMVASKCRQLRVLDLIEDEVTDDEVDWISFFPDGGTCLESLIFDCVECPINFDALEKLVARSPSLKKLRLNRYVSLGQLHRLMILAPQLTHLGTGSEKNLILLLLLLLLLIYYTVMSIRVFFVLALFLLSAPFLQVVRCQSESDSEGEAAEEVGELGIVGDDVQDYSGGSFSPAPGVETVCVFPKNPSKLVVAGEITELLVGLKYEGESNLNVIAVQASVHLPYDHNLLIQNLSSQAFDNTTVPPSAQATFPYIFAVSKFLQAGTFDLVGTIVYEIEQQPYQSTFYNGTIEVTEAGGPLSVESVFLFSLGVALLFLFGLWVRTQITQFSKKTKRAAKVEVGTATTDASMDEWLEGTAYTQSLSSKSKKKK